MKTSRAFLVVATACLSTGLLVSCPTPVTTNNNPVPNLLTYPPYPGINIQDNVIYGVNSNMQYSLHGDIDTYYTDCGGGIVHVTFEKDDDVWVRATGAPLTAKRLGVVANLGSYPDLAPSNLIGLTVSNVAPGEQARILYKYYNIGSASANRSFAVTFYLSTDKIITTDDTLVATSTGTHTMSIGLDPEGENYYYPVDFTVPSSLAYGTYYLGYILDSGSDVEELNEDNNASPPEAVAEIYVTDVTPNTDGGAFKVVNSWGVGGSWENVADGHYWLTYQTVKALQLSCFYYRNDDTALYQPTAIAVFRITHPERDKCRIVLGLGDPDNPVVSKEFQPRYGDVMYSGALPFPPNEMALDVSEFASMISSADLFLKITTAAGAAGGAVNSFAVNFYSASDGTPLGSISGDGGDFAGNGGVTVFAAHTTGAVPAGVVPPVARSAAQKAVNPFLETKPTAEELARDMARVGVSVPGRSYAKVVDGSYGTGWAPPSEAEWTSMKLLVGFQSALAGSTPSNEKVDHSTEQYFPPVGNQGTEGSCAAWSTAYYVHTYYMAREHGWNLTGTTWVKGSSSYGDPGYPSNNRDKIFSPDFIYHQIDGGGDNGSSYPVAITQLINMGCSPWENMPYFQSDSTTWPSAVAFTKAASYRGSDMPTLYGTLQFGYFIIRTDADINLLKTLLKNNYLVTCAIDADNTDADGVTLYQFLDANDVIDRGSFPSMHLNHAQTIVGFKDGTAWHPATPDD
jgi:hypothetical protein